MDVIALDKIQKRWPIDDDAFRRLKAEKLIEGRRPNPGDGGGLPREIRRGDPGRFG